MTFLRRLVAMAAGLAAALAMAAPAAASVYWGNLIGAAPPVSTSAPPSGIDTVIGFDDLADGDEVTTQYVAQGVEFGEPDNFGLPGVGLQDLVVRARPSQASSPPNVAEIVCHGEFCAPDIAGRFSVFRQTVGVWAGDLASSGSSDVTLTAYDAARHVVGRDTVAVPAGVGVHRLLQVGTAAPDIAYFDVSGSEVNTPVAIDDVTFDNPFTVPPPDFQLSRSASFPVEVVQSRSGTATIDILRFNGSTGGVSLSADTPPGVSAAFTPDPATGDNTTLTLTAGPGAAVGEHDIVVTGTPTSDSVGSATHQVVVAVDVLAPFVVRELGSEDLPGCATAFSIPVDIAFGFNDPIHLSLNSGPYQGSLSPATVVRPASGSAEATMTLSAPPGAPASGTVTITATSGPFTSQRVITVRGQSARIDSISSEIGRTPQALQPGDLIRVDGAGFCPTLPVEFGNSFAVATPASVRADGTELTVRVPRLATDGPLTIGGTPSDGFKVLSYRNTSGFSFANYGGHGLAFEDLVDLFGYDQTHFKADVCSWVSFGLFSCNLVTTPLPDPGALVFLASVEPDLSKGGGRCFGMALASLRFLTGDRSLSDFATLPTQRTTWDLPGPGGPRGDLDHYIHLMHLEQDSLEGLLTRQHSSDQTMSAQGIRRELEDMLRAGRHPLLRVRQGDQGHIVVPYDVEDRGAAGYTIHVYNPNLPFLASENGDAVQHEDREFNSRVLVDRANDGSWQWSLSDPDWSGTLPDDSDLSRGGNFGPMTLSVLPYEAFPIQPTLPGSIAQGVVLLLDGNARADAVSAGGQPVPYLTPLDSHDAHGAWILPGQGPYAATVQGTGAGTYGETFLGRTLTARISDIPAAGAKRDHIGADPRTQSITFATAAESKPFAVELVGHGNGLAETAALRATSFRGGRDTVALAGSGLMLHHVGPATTVEISLSAVGRRLAPSTFQSGMLRIGANETATFRPRQLTALADGAVNVTLTRRGRVVTRSTLHSRPRTTAAVSVGRLHVLRAGGNVTLTVRVALHRLPRGSTAVAVWFVRRNGRVIAHHTVTLGAGQLRTGVRTLRWTARLPRHGRLVVTAGVAALTPAATSYQSLVRSASRAIAVG